MQLRDIIGLVKNKNVDETIGKILDLYLDTKDFNSRNGKVLFEVDKNEYKTSNNTPKEYISFVRNTVFKDYMKEKGLLNEDGTFKVNSKDELKSYLDECLKTFDYNSNIDNLTFSSKALGMNSNLGELKHVLLLNTKDNDLINVLETVYSEFKKNNIAFYINIPRLDTILTTRKDRVSISCSDENFDKTTEILLNIKDKLSNMVNNPTIFSQNIDNLFGYITYQEYENNNSKDNGLYSDKVLGMCIIKAIDTCIRDYYTVKENNEEKINELQFADKNKDNIRINLIKDIKSKGYDIYKDIIKETRNRLSRTELDQEYVFLPNGVIEHKNNKSEEFEIELPELKVERNYPVRNQDVDEIKRKALVDIRELIDPIIKLDEERAKLKEQEDEITEEDLKRIDQKIVRPVVRKKYKSPHYGYEATEKINLEEVKDKIDNDTKELITPSTLADEEEVNTKELDALFGSLKPAEEEKIEPKTDDEQRISVEEITKELEKVKPTPEEVMDLSSINEKKETNEKISIDEKGWEPIQKPTEIDESKFKVEMDDSKVVEPEDVISLNEEEKVAVVANNYENQKIDAKTEELINDKRNLIKKYEELNIPSDILVSTVIDRKGKETTLVEYLESEKVLDKYPLDTKVKIIDDDEPITAQEFINKYVVKWALEYGNLTLNDIVEQAHVDTSGTAKLNSDGGFFKNLFKRR